MKEVLFIEYPKCTTCQKAKKWLKEHKINFIDRHIVDENPTKEELTRWIVESEIPVKSFFNTSGILYKQNNLKEKLETMELSEKIELLASNGMLVKRPLIITEDTVLIGFKEKQWEQALLK